MNVALYARVSTADQTLEVQLRELRGYATQHGHTVHSELSDVISGSKAERPGLSQLMALVRSRQIDAVLVVKLDRMARSLVHFATLAAEFVKLDVALICTTQGIDTSSSNPCGKFQQNILAAVAEFERDLIRERTRAGLAAARARGVVLGRRSIRMPEDRAAVVNQWRAAGRLGGVPRSGAHARRHQSGECHAD